MTKKLKKVHEAVAEKVEKDKERAAEVQAENPLVGAVAAWRWPPSAR